MEKSAKLGRGNWIAAGLRAIADSGSQGLKADVLAKLLGVSRGSFYWHFSDVGDFHRAILQAWENAAVDEPWLLASKADATDPVKILSRLVRQAFSGSMALETAVLAWAAEFPPAAAAVQRVNERRLEILTHLFEQIGLAPPTASIRAFLTCTAYLGRIQLGKNAVLTRLEQRRLLEFLTERGSLQGT